MSQLVVLRCATCKEVIAAHLYMPADEVESVVVYHEACRPPRATATRREMPMPLLTNVAGALHALGSYAAHTEQDEAEYAAMNEAEKDELHAACESLYRLGIEWNEHAKRIRDIRAREHRD